MLVAPFAGGVRLATSAWSSERCGLLEARRAALFLRCRKLRTQRFPQIGSANIEIACDKDRRMRHDHADGKKRGP